MGFSTADYLRMLARLGQRQQDAGRTPEGVTREADLHAAILDWCAAQSPRPWLALHGSTAHRTHRTPGEPDFVILAPAGRVLLVECKARREKPSNEQAALAAWAAALGHRVNIVRTLEEFVTATKDLA